MEKISQLAAGTICVNCDVVNDRIARLEIHGDFFAGEALSRLCEALIGCRYEKDTVYDVLTDKKSDNIIYGISREDLLKAMF